VAQEDFAAVDLSGEGGLRLGEVREALQLFARHKNVIALESSIIGSPGLDLTFQVESELLAEEEIFGLPSNTRAGHCRSKQHLGQNRKAQKPSAEGQKGPV
jgi:hypothetical protein